MTFSIQVDIIAGSNNINLDTKSHLSTEIVLSNQLVAIASSNNINLDTKSHLSTEIVLSNQHQERHHCSKTTKLGKDRMKNNKN